METVNVLMQCPECYGTKPYYEGCALCSGVGRVLFNFDEEDFMRMKELDEELRRQQEEEQRERGG